MRLRNVSPLGQIDVPVLGREGGVEFDDDGLPIRVEGTGCLEPGEVFECPDELAGRPPSEDDRGSGLLAQVGVFELVEDEEPAEPDPEPEPEMTETTKARRGRGERS